MPQTGLPPQTDVFLLLQYQLGPIVLRMGFQCIFSSIINAKYIY